jgi:hypothetical protein
MRFWLFALLLFSAPLFGQRSGDADPSSDDEPVDTWQDFEVGGLADGEYLPLTLGRDRTGLGLKIRGAMGFDNNVFKEDRNVDGAFLMDGMAYAYVGANFGLLSLGARGHLAGRLHFGEPDADMWDMKLGGFIKMPYAGGGFGFGISGDALYQQLQTYEIAGPLVRQDDLRAGGYIARAHLGYAVGFIILEGGITGQISDYSEEKNLRSLDNWELGADLGVYLDFFGVVRLHPYVKFDYNWFRDQVDVQDDGTPLSDTDKLQLLTLSYGADFEIDFGFFRAQGRAYGDRQDDSAAGFARYWQYGIRGAADFVMISGIRLTVGAHFWTREYDDRDDFDNGQPTTLNERYFDGWAEMAWNFWEFFSVGGRYRYTRRISGLDNGGYAAHEITGFLEIAF